MSDADHFLACIDANPGEPFYLAVYADWLDERGEPSAEAWRWLASEGKVPVDGFVPAPSQYYWASGESRNPTNSLPWLSTEDFWSDKGNPYHDTRSVAYQWAVAEYLAARARGWVPERKDVVR